MSLLDFEDIFQEPFKPKPGDVKIGASHDNVTGAFNEFARQVELENHDREDEPEDYSKSPHLDY